MKILVINCGSSSLKSTLFQMPERRVLAGGMVEKIGEGNAVLHCEVGGDATQEDCRADDHSAALHLLIRSLMEHPDAAIESLEEIAAVGHRVVHGGELSRSVLVDDETIDAIRQNTSLAPLHNPPNLAGLEAAVQMMPGTPQVAVFDTAFHTTMPPRAYMYALPYSLYAEHRVRAYGFHGTSHRYVAGRAAELLGIPLEKASLITLHLGNGCSATAVKEGRSVDTSMGMTPLEGLVMGTRCGDVDPALFSLLMERLKLDPGELYDLYNRQSGLLGLSGLSNDVREILAAAGAGHERAQLALDVFAYRARKYVGAYLAALGRLDAVVFTAGIGENCPCLRRLICEGLEGLGIALDAQKNDATLGREARVSVADSPVAILVVPTDEALQIALETYEVLQKGTEA